MYEYTVYVREHDAVKFLLIYNANIFWPYLAHHSGSSLSDVARNVPIVYSGEQRIQLRIKRLIVLITVDQCCGRIRSDPRLKEIYVLLTFIVLLSL
jgi:hypothetical protein